MGLVRTLLAGVALAAGAFAVLGTGTAIEYLRTVTAVLPDHRVVLNWQPEEGTRILAADGTLIAVHARQRREFVPFNAIPKLVVDAFLAAEDGSYWAHSGIDPTAIARALLSNLKAGHSTQGGSTITQQVVKNLIIGDEKSLSRKVKEALLAMRLDRDVGKAKVLEIYLNQIYLGSGSYGVAAAARTYFGKSLEELSPGEAALLAGMPKAPGTSDPYRNPSRALERRNYVIGRMGEEGFLSPSITAATLTTPLNVVPKRNEADEIDPAMRYPEEEVRRRLVRQVGSDAVYGKGATVTTTIRPETQRAVHVALRRGLVNEDRRGGWRGPIGRVDVSRSIDWSRVEKPAGAEDWNSGVVVDSGRDALVMLPGGDRVSLSGRSMTWATSTGRSDSILRRGDVVLVGDLGHGPELVQIPEVQGAAALLDPSSGDVLALDGGFSYEISEFNRASQAKRQTGSVFKTFVYLAALELGYDATSPVLDAPIAIDQGPGQSDWRPQDSTGAGLGLITLRKSLEQSRNMSTVRLLYDIGPDAVRSVADRVGFDLPSRISYAMALGASEATPLEVASAYAAIANGGRRVSPRFFETADAGEVGSKKSLDEVAAAQVTSILRGVVSSGTARRAFSGFKRPVAAKTGTTNDQRDAWLVAYGPRFVLAVWIGRDDHKPLRQGASGGTTAAPVARDILDHAPGIDFAEFPLPDQAAEIPVRRETGQRTDKGDVIEIMRTETDDP